MFKIISWNARGLGSSTKRRALKEILSSHHIDIVGIQETKKENFTNITLTALSSSITNWTFKSSNGASGGILLGLNDSKFWILDTWIREFTITLHVKNKTDNFEWLLTVTYGLVQSYLRITFLAELQSIPTLGPPVWLVFGDFNIIRKRSERQGPSYNFILSNRFNTIISNLNLIEAPLTDRKFSWSRSLASTSKALLDRFFSAPEWNAQFPHSIVTSLPKIYSDHNPIILQTNSITIQTSTILRFEKSWIDKEGFIDLIYSW